MDAAAAGALLMIYKYIDKCLAGKAGNSRVCQNRLQTMTVHHKLMYKALCSTFGNHHSLR